MAGPYDNRQIKEWHNHPCHLRLLESWWSEEKPGASICQEKEEVFRKEQQKGCISQRRVTSWVCFSKSRVFFKEGERKRVSLKGEHLESIGTKLQL